MELTVRSNAAASLVFMLFLVRCAAGSTHRGEFHEKMIATGETTGYDGHGSVGIPKSTGLDRRTGPTNVNAYHFAAGATDMECTDRGILGMYAE